MGMYDTIDFPAEILRQFKDERLQKYVRLASGDSDFPLSFQTKDLYRTLDIFHFVKNDRGEYVMHQYRPTRDVRIDLPDSPDQLSWSDIMDMVVSPDKKENERKSVPHIITRTIDCIDVFDSNEIDITIDIRVILNSGKVQAIEVLEYTEKDPTERLLGEAELLKSINETQAYSKTIRGRINRRVRKFLHFICRGLQKLQNAIMKVSFKL